MSTTISQLTTASTSELDGDFELVINTVDNKARKAAMSDIKSRKFCNIGCVRVEVSNADLLDLFDTPIEIVPAAGAGTALQILGGFIDYTYDTAVFGSATTVYMGTELSYDDGWEVGSILAATASTKQYFTMVGNTWNNGDGLNENESIVLSTVGANPTLGGGSAVVYCTYAQITL